MQNQFRGKNRKRRRENWKGAKSKGKRVEREKGATENGKPILAICGDERAVGKEEGVVLQQSKGTARAGRI